MKNCYQGSVTLAETLLDQSQRGLQTPVSWLRKEILLQVSEI